MDDKNPFTEEPNNPFGDSTVVDMGAVEGAVAVKRKAFGEMGQREKLDFLSSGPPVDLDMEFERTILGKLSIFLQKVGRKLAGFAKEAIEIAVYKFIVELCAMVMTAIAASLTGRKGRGMDITTPGVTWTGQPGGQQGQQAQATGQRPNNWDNPFNDWNSSRGSSMPW